MIALGHSVQVFEILVFCLNKLNQAANCNLPFGLWGGPFVSAVIGSIIPSGHFYIDFSMALKLGLLM